MFYLNLAGLLTGGACSFLFNKIKLYAKRGVSLFLADASVYFAFTQLNYVFKESVPSPFLYFFDTLAAGYFMQRAIAAVSELEQKILPCEEEKEDKLLEKLSVLSDDDKKPKKLKIVIYDPEGFFQQVEPEDYPYSTK